jgi:hypothetical protein
LIALQLTSDPVLREHDDALLQPAQAGQLEPPAVQG